MACNLYFHQLLDKLRLTPLLAHFLDVTHTPHNILNSFLEHSPALNIYILVSSLTSFAATSVELSGAHKEATEAAITSNWKQALAPAADDGSNGDGDINDNGDLIQVSLSDGLQGRA